MARATARAKQGTVLAEDSARTVPFCVGYPSGLARGAARESYSHAAETYPLNLIRFVPA